MTSTCASKPSESLLKRLAQEPLIPVKPKMSLSIRIWRGRRLASTVSRVVPRVIVVPDGVHQFVVVVIALLEPVLVFRLLRQEGFSLDLRLQLWNRKNRVQVIASDFLSLTSEGTAGITYCMIPVKAKTMC